MPIMLWVPRLYAEAKRAIEANIEHYRVHGGRCEPHVYAKLEFIKKAPSLGDAILRKDKAIDSSFNNCLALWARGQADGPRTARRMESEAKKLEGLAKFLDSKGKKANADKQRAKAQAIRDEIKREQK